MSRSSKIKNLFLVENTGERIFSLLEIWWNRRFYSTPISRTSSLDFSDFVLRLRSSQPFLSELLEPSGAAEAAVASIRRGFSQTIQQETILFPLFFNADISFAMLCYGIALARKPAVAVEAGIGYGIISATVLEAMQKNEKGRLLSIDLPPLGDPSGSLIGIAVPYSLRHRWEGGYRGGVRKWLPVILSKEQSIDLYISDSANVFTLERHEFLAVWPKLSPGGVMIFNNVNQKFYAFLQKKDNMELHIVRQIEKSSCTTAIIFKANEHELSQHRRIKS